MTTFLIVYVGVLAIFSFLLTNSVLNRSFNEGVLESRAQRGEPDLVGDEQKRLLIFAACFCAVLWPIVVSITIFRWIFSKK